MASNDGWGDGQPTTDEHGGVKAGGQAGVDTNSVQYTQRLADCT